MNEKNAEMLLCLLSVISRSIDREFSDGEYSGYAFCLRDVGAISEAEFWRLLNVKHAVKDETAKRGHPLAKKTTKKIFEETK